MAPLLPKLRGYFAEFLDQVSLLRLGIFYPSTCVGLRYGPLLLGLFLALGLVMRIGRSLTSEFDNLVTFPYASSQLGSGILT